jgi:hypothetical protein
MCFNGSRITNAAGCTQQDAIPCVHRGFEWMMMQSAQRLNYDIEQGSVRCAIQRGEARTTGLEFVYDTQLHHAPGELLYIDSLVALWSQSQRSFRHWKQIHTGSRNVPKRKARAMRIKARSCILLKSQV